MARCEECLHYPVCAKECRLAQIDEHTWDNYNQLDDVEKFCDNYISTADVVAKSEADTWYQLYHSIKEELKLEKMYHRETENLCDRYCIESQQAKKQVAREIFEEIEKLSYRFMNDKHYIFGDMVWDIAELKKKYTEGKDEQASIQTDHKEEFKK